MRFDALATDLAPDLGAMRPPWMNRACHAVWADMGTEAASSQLRFDGLSASSCSSATEYSRADPSLANVVRA